MKTNSWNITETEPVLVSSTVLNLSVPKLTSKPTNKQLPQRFETFTLSRKVGKLSEAQHKRRKLCRFQWELAISEGTSGTKAYPRSQQDHGKIHYKVRHGVLAPGWTEGCNINTCFITAELEPCSFRAAEIRDGTHQTDFPRKTQGLQSSPRKITNYRAEPIYIHRIQLLFGSSLSWFLPLQRISKSSSWQKPLNIFFILQQKFEQNQDIKTQSNGNEFNIFS